MNYPCPCCGFLTLPVPREDAPSDENRGLTLRQGRENFARFGAVRPDLVRHVRPPTADELPLKNQP